MDDTNDNIFTNGSAGIENPPAIDNGKLDGGNGNPAGRIDPAIARSAGEAGSGPAYGSEPPTATGNPGPTNDTGGTPGGPAGQPAPRGRGRPRKDGTNPPAKESGEARNIRASFVEKTLFAIHTGVAVLTKCPEFSLDKEDAKTLGDGVAGVLAFHKIRMTPKQEAYGILMEAVALIYPPMLASVYFRKKMEAEAKAKNAPPAPPKNITPFPTAQPVEASLKPTGFDPAKIQMPG